MCVCVCACVCVCVLVLSVRVTCLQCVRDVCGGRQCLVNIAQFFTIVANVYELLQLCYSIRDFVESVCTYITRKPPSLQSCVKGKHGWMVCVCVCLYVVEGISR